jgi:hypothetical protein
MVLSPSAGRRVDGWVSAFSGCECPAAVPVETEGGESLEVDGRDALSKADAVAFDAAVADFAVSVAYEPGEGAFDHRPVATVDVVELIAVCVAAGGGQ